MDYTCKNLVKRSMKLGCTHDQNISNQLYATCIKKLQNSKQFSGMRKVYTLLPVGQFEFRHKFYIQPYVRKQVFTLLLLVKHEVSLLGEMDFL